MVLTRCQQLGRGRATARTLGRWQGQTGGEQAAKTAVLLILPRVRIAPSDHEEKQPMKKGFCATE